MQKKLNEPELNSSFTHPYLRDLFRRADRSHLSMLKTLEKPRIQQAGRRGLLPSPAPSHIDLKKASASTSYTTATFPVSLCDLPQRLPYPRLPSNPPPVD